MRVKVAGHEKFRIFRKRTGLQFSNFIDIWKVDMHKNTLSSWTTGKMKPNSFFRKHIHILTKKLSPKGKYSLVVSPIDWISTSKIEIYTGELLMLWRLRNGITVRQLRELTGTSITLISYIENGTYPSDEFKDSIFKITEGLITTEMWDEDLKQENDFF